MWRAVLALLAVAAPQADITITGRVIRVTGRDTVGAPGARVLLHRVMASRQGPIDSMLAGPDGSFHFRLHPEAGALYLASARWSGIEYFAPPIVLDRRATNETVRVAVADTSSNAPIVLVSRHLVVATPAADGTRGVIEMFVLENPGPNTRVSSDSSATTWRTLLPAEIARVQLGETDFATDVVELRGDTLRIRAPLPPGQRQLTVQYQLPPGMRSWSIAVDQPVSTMNVLLEEPSAQVSGPLHDVAPEAIEGKQFARWQGAAPRGTSVVISFEPSGVPGWLLPTMVACLAAGLLGAGFVALRTGRVGSNAS
jgi:hypothetical protein